MKTFLDCVPCFVGQALGAARFVTDDESIHEEVLRKVMSNASKMDLSLSPPKIGQEIHRLIRQITGNKDPYRDIKEHSNQLALGVYSKLKERIEDSSDPFETAVRIAIAGNIIDFAKMNDLDDAKIHQAIEDSFTVALSKSAVNDFRNAIDKSKNILYIGDNAGEIVFDRLLLEQLSCEKITFVVRGGPVINDATMDDARTAGLAELVEVIDNGSDVPGTIVETCSEQFRKRFNSADLIISKGQGNYETLS
ncbi:MAG: DUF89 family protein, partial [Desulfobulbaceae bacterium]|nr:DUF89 family protein [Desulfobulbaceae bacterium]